MPRTTLHIDATVLRELKRRQQREKKSLGQLASELLAIALSDNAQTADRRPLEWKTAPMNASIDVTDKDELFKVLDDR